jgi:hypothetical protein
MLDANALCWFCHDEARLYFMFLSTSEKNVIQEKYSELVHIRDSILEEVQCKKP